MGFILGEPDHLAEFQNVSTMFETIERCFANKVYDKSGDHLEEDDAKTLAIAGAVQPDFIMHDV